ncbi:MAG: DHH family phosphoesterase [Methanothrix sp.]|jgi:single-stranded-DNA-specific exonuclease|uniref:DHHA1 domain-containing protein n=1 Tax=Methanothrix sp. TaxID=90426 RepID=UPI002B93082C|nr:DHH family phosphoesterase [Methanothrix sp.]
MAGGAEARSMRRFDELNLLCKGCGDLICKHKEISVVSHVDADGLTAAAIICTALKRRNIEYKPLFFRQLDEAALDEVADQGADLVIFTDLGSGMIQEISDRRLDAIVADHHKPQDCSSQPLAHINPHLVGADGANQLSGSGSSFLLARALASDPGANDDLAALAVVGAVGDLQDMASGQLIGLNRHILDIGSRAGVIDYCRDIKLFGRQTRPVYKMLEYSQDPYLPGLSGKEDACIDFLKEIGIRLGGERWRRWIDLSQEEKAAVVTAIIQKGMRSGISNTRLERLIGEVYILLKEREGTELKDASEYSTLLNATARYGHASVGLKVSMGDREKALDQARALLGQHRQNLVAGLKLVAERGITPLKSIQYFDAGDAILDTIIGIVAGMSFQMADRNRPILAFAQNEEGDLKVSARGTQDLVRSGLDLASALSLSARAVGGMGGGHNVAAGATIPQKAKEEFLQMMDSIISEQLSGKNDIKIGILGAGQ